MGGVPENYKADNIFSPRTLPWREALLDLSCSRLSLPTERSRWGCPFLNSHIRNQRSGLSLHSPTPYFIINSNQTTTELFEAAYPPWPTLEPVWNAPAKETLAKSGL